MEREKLLAQLKAFQAYLKNYMEAEKPPQTIPPEESEEYEEYEGEQAAKQGELSFIIARYKSLKQAVNQEYADIFGGLNPSFIKHSRAVAHMYREVGFILDTITNLDSHSSNQTTSYKPNNQPFTKDEVQIINHQLDEFQDKLIGIVNNEKLSQEKTVLLIESVKNEIDDLKAEAANQKIGRKDWKNQLINAMINLMLILSFSQEARNTIQIFFHDLLIYLQQHIFLLKP